MDFSVIIPTRNRARALTRCLRAIAELDFPRDRFEVIVVDDGSAPPIAVPTEDLPVRLLRQAHGGAAAARNTGAAEARGRYLVFTDDDCRPRPDWLRRLAGRFARDPDCAITGRKMTRPGSGLLAAANQAIIDAVYDHYNRHRDEALACNTSSLALPARTFRACGGFDPAFRSWEDQELGCRLRGHGCRLLFDPEVAVEHDRGDRAGAFLRRHFQLGRGAWRFHRSRRRRGGRRWRPEPAFYLRLARHTLFNGHGLRAVPLAVWVAFGQLAYAAGAAREAAAQD